MPLNENNRNYPLRRQSAISDFKPKVLGNPLKICQNKYLININQLKVSKWTKVKAAFKWEKANTLTLNESKSSDSILSPHNDSFK